MKKIICGGLFMILSFSCLWSQDYFDVFNFRYSYLPANEFKEYPGITVHLTNINADLGIPFELKNKDIFLLRPGYQFFKADVTSDSLSGLQLTYIKLPVGFVHTWKNNKWTTYFEILPKLNSDMKNISSDHFQVGGTLLNYYKKSEKLTYEVGIFYNGETYGPFVVPLLGMEWKPDSNVYLNILLPSILQLEIKAAKKWFVGFETELAGETYRLGDTRYAGSFISNFGENKLTFLIKSRFFADFYLTDHLVLFVKPGIRLAQKNDQFTKEDELLVRPDYIPERISGTLKNSFYCEFGLALRYRN